MLLTPKPKKNPFPSLRQSFSKPGVICRLGEKRLETVSGDLAGAGEGSSMREAKCGAAPASLVQLLWGRVLPQSSCSTSTLPGTGGLLSAAAACIEAKNLRNEEFLGWLLVCQPVQGPQLEARERQRG